ncbi:MAG: hypothetical protein AVDCRST_MAG56-6224, partial [uncultured Cytophagales bacterium]
GRTGLDPQRPGGPAGRQGNGIADTQPQAGINGGNDAQAQRAPAHSGRDSAATRHGHGL